MIFTHIEIAWILICLAIGSIVAATIGFGDALIIIPLLSLIMDPRSAIIFIGYWGLLMNIVNLLKYRNFTEKKYIMPVISGGIFGSILGAMLIIVIMLRYLEIGLGIVILSFVGLKFFKNRSVNFQVNNQMNSTSASDTSASDTSASDTSAFDTSAFDTSASDTSASDTSAFDTSAFDTSAFDTSAFDTIPHYEVQNNKSKDGCGELNYCIEPVPKKCRSIANESFKILPAHILVPGGFLYAFLGALLGASGPINVMMLQSSGFKKERFIANFAGCGLFLTIIKITAYTALGLFPIDNIWLLIAGYPVVFLSAKIGHGISKRWSSEKFEFIVYCVLVMMAFNFIF